MNFFDDGCVEQLRGFVATPSGAKIPVIVAFKETRSVESYSHVGQINIPNPWVDEFEELPGQFYFRAECGECFTQFQIVEEVDDQPGKATRVGRMILLRDTDSAALVSA